MAAKMTTEKRMMSMILLFLFVFITCMYVAKYIKIANFADLIIAIRSPN